MVELRNCHYHFGFETYDVSRFIYRLLAPVPVYVGVVAARCKSDSGDASVRHCSAVRRFFRGTPGAEESCRCRYARDTFALPRVDTLCLTLSSPSVPIKLVYYRSLRAVTAIVFRLLIHVHIGAHKTILITIFVLLFRLDAHQVVITVAFLLT